MCRFVAAGSSVLRTLRRPMVWVALFTWVGLMPLVHALLPVAPTHRFDLDAAARLMVAEQLGLEDPSKIAGDVSIPVDISPDGNTVLARHPLIGKLYFWDIQSGAVQGSTFSESERYSQNEMFAKDDTWIPKKVTVKKEVTVQFLHRHTGKVSENIPLEFARSARGNLVAYSDGNANHLLDLDTGKTRFFLLAPNVAQAPLVPIAPRCFSDDERLLAGDKDEFVVVVDVASGAIRAKLPYRSKDDLPPPAVIAFAPNGQAIAWQYDRDVVVTDFEDKGKRCVVKNAMLIGWQPSGHVLTAQRGDFLQTTSYLELWDWRANRAVARWDAPSDARFVVARYASWGSRPPIFISRPRDGRHVLFAGYVENSAPSPWLAKLRGWLRMPEKHGLNVEVSLLDGETLALRDQWHIPVESHRDGILQVTADGQHLVFTDGYVVEHWPVPSRSWLTSALWAGIGPVMLVVVATIWRFWRGRKRATISPTPPPANATEVSDAKT